MAPVRALERIKAECGKVHHLPDSPTQIFDALGLRWTLFCQVCVGGFSFVCVSVVFLLPTRALLYA